MPQNIVCHTHFLRSLSFLLLALGLKACAWSSSVAALRLWKTPISSSRVLRFSSSAPFSSACSRFNCSNFPCSWRQRRQRATHTHTWLYHTQSQYRCEEFLHWCQSTNQRYFISFHMNRICAFYNDIYDWSNQMTWFLMCVFYTSLSASLSSASFSFTRWTKVCLISSSRLCSSPRNSRRFASYVCCRLSTHTHRSWNSSVCLRQEFDAFEISCCSFGKWTLSSFKLIIICCYETEWISVLFSSLMKKFVV